MESGVKRKLKPLWGFSLMSFFFFLSLFLAGVRVQLGKISGTEMGLCDLGINN